MLLSTHAPVLCCTTPPPHVTAAMIVQVINQLGGWANYIATMDLVERLGGGSAVLVSYVVVIRMLPSLFMFPVAGVVADRQVPASALMVRPSSISGGFSGLLSYVVIVVRELPSCLIELLRHAGLLLKAWWP